MDRVAYSWEIPGLYDGANCVYFFESDSVRMVKPIAIREFSAAVPEVTRFSQAKQSIPIGRLEVIKELLDSRPQIFREELVRE